MPEPLLYDRRHEEHCRHAELYQEGLEALYDDMETEDLLLNLTHATGEDRVVILEILEVRGAMKPVAEMERFERCKHFNAMTSQEMYDTAHSSEAIQWPDNVLFAFALAMANRLKFPWQEPERPCAICLETADLLAQDQAIKEKAASVSG